MSRQLLGKRSRSKSTSSPSPPTTSSPYKTRRSTRIPPSPEPTPNPKRVKISGTELQPDDGSNKENIPPEPSFSSLTPLDASINSPNFPSQVTTSHSMTPRSMRASRRVAISNAPSTPISHRRVSAPRSLSDPSIQFSSVSGSENRTQLVVETPTKSLASLSLATPPATPEAPALISPQDVSRNKSAPLHVQARALLRPQTHESSPLIGREQEKTHILNFLAPFFSNKVRADSPTSLYISGAPGTGKTALVNEVLTNMSADSASVHVLYVNCMTLDSKDGLTGVWERCAEGLDVRKDSKRDIITPKLNWSRRFAKLFEDKKCVLVLDEIDHLTTSNAISQVFAMASVPQTSTTLRIIGISNTHTLTHSQPTPDTLILHFEPYTAAQMKAVLISRLVPLQNDTIASKLFPTATIALLAMKIANQTGDIRTVFSVARRALDLAVTGSASQSPLTVTPAHVLAALKASNTSVGASQGKSGAETVTRVRNLGLQARFALAALLLATRRIRSGLALTSSSPHTSPRKSKANAQTSSTRANVSQSVDLTILHDFYTAILSRGADTAFLIVGRTEFTDLIGLLEGSGLVELSQGRGFGTKTNTPTKSKGVPAVSIATNIREEELVRGLVGSSTHSAENVDVREEEVKHIWEKENTRINQETKAKLQDAGTNKANFEGAEED